MTKKYSSFKNHQLLTESWRSFLNEDDGPEHALGKWAKMFPRAAKALEAMGAKIEDIKKAIDDAHPEDESPEAALRRKMAAHGSAGSISSDIMEEEK